ncbi:MAG: IS3 family transposase [Anaerolineaceae bacterium]|nr:IS3 family transposase [Anaerolineaceae bacterium]
MTYEQVAACAVEYPLARVCAVLNLSESGYYAWKQRPPSEREQENQTLKARIHAVWQTFRRSYGAPRIQAELQAQGYAVGKNRVARLMRTLGIQGKGGQKRRPRTTQSAASHPVKPNVLARQFAAERPDQVWLTDITYIETEVGFLYTAGVMDLYSRQIVGLAMAEHMRSELTETALEMAFTQRQPDTEEADLTHHSDRGSQYTCSTYQQMLARPGITVSMSRSGNCLDNAPMESFWATLKRECADGVFASFEQAKAAIFSYVMGFYNRVRRHSALDYLSPHDFEMQFLRQTCTPLN